LETNRENSDAVTEWQDVPKEDVVVETIWALEDRFGDWHLAEGRRRQPKKLTQGDDGSRKK
jgi:hypothetical protein